MRRRWAVAALICGIGLGTFESSLAQAPLQPLRLKLIRVEGTNAPLDYTGCILGKLYLVASLSTIPDRIASGELLGDTLELPWKENVGHISSIPPGRYTGKVRRDGQLGWRIELAGTGHRTHIQIHTGGRRVTNTSQTEGCILPGRRAPCEDGSRCCLTNSPAVMQALREAFGDIDTRDVEILIVE